MQLQNLCVGLLGNQLFCRVVHRVGGDAEVFEESRGGGARTVAVHADEDSAEAEVPFPAELAGRFARDAVGHTRGKDALLVLRRLLAEEEPARHRDDAGRDALGGQLFVRFDAERQLAAGTDEDDRRLAVRGIGQDVRALGGTAGRGVLGSVECREVLPGEDHGGRAVLDRDDRAVGFGHFVSVAGPHVD